MLTARSAAVIGGGPAGLMAAEELAAAGVAVTVYDGMPTVGRKFLMAGRGGLNLTHAEPEAGFLARYGEAAAFMTPLLRDFPPAALRAWCAGLGVETFVGSSGRVFPTGLKASPLLRAWLARLAGQGVAFRPGHRWRGWTRAGALAFEARDGSMLEATHHATVLALGGASWPRLGADGGWVPLLSARGVPVTALQPANAGLRVAWSAHFRDRLEGAPLKNIALSLGRQRVAGELVLTRAGIEGGAAYALTAAVRAALAHGPVLLSVDLKPDLAEAEIERRVALPRRGASLANHLRKALRLDRPALALLREAVPGLATLDAAGLARSVKRLALPVDGVSRLERAISTAGGIRLDALDRGLMLRALPGVFAAGEMLDWEAPTGGYLLQGCFCTGRAAGRGALAWLGAEAAVAL